jgi:hypothetical protein
MYVPNVIGTLLSISGRDMESAPADIRNFKPITLDESLLGLKLKVLKKGFVGSLLSTRVASLVGTLFIIVPG